jgi:RecJ-like exonuclease
MDKNTNCDPCEEQGNITEGKSWCPNCDITEILLEVALDTIKQTNKQTNKLNSKG